MAISAQKQRRTIHIVTFLVKTLWMHAVYFFTNQTSLTRCVYCMVCHHEVVSCFAMLLDVRVISVQFDFQLFIRFVPSCNQVALCLPAFRSLCAILQSGRFVPSCNQVALCHPAFMFSYTAFLTTVERSQPKRFGNYKGPRHSIKVCEEN